MAAETTPAAEKQGPKGPLALLTMLALLLIFSFVSTSTVLQMLFSSDRVSAAVHRQQLDSLLRGTAQLQRSGAANSGTQMQAENTLADDEKPVTRPNAEPSIQRPSGTDQEATPGSSYREGLGEGLDEVDQQQPEKEVDRAEEEEEVKEEEEEGDKEEEEEEEDQEGEDTETIAGGAQAGGQKQKRGSRGRQTGSGKRSPRGSSASGRMGAGSAVSFKIDPMNIAAFEGAEEDKEMALIYEIVKLAEQKELQQKQEIEQEQAQEAKAMGMTLAQFQKHQQAVGSMSSSILDTPCQSVKDCASSCLESCQHQQISEQCRSMCRPQCHSQCAGSVEPASPKKGKKASKAGGLVGAGGSSECLMQCDRNCRTQCLAHKAEELEQMQMECKATTDRICALECRESRESDICTAACMARGQAECRKQYEGECEAGCGKHLCVDGQCRCPVYFSGDPMCSSVMQIHHMMPNGLKHCSTPYTDDRFKKNSGGNFTVLDYRSRSNPSMLKIHHDNSLQTGARLHPEPDLKDLADFSTCAVVGSSSTLKGARMGAEIDSHTAVIRFNDAPTKNYQADVGSKTTLRLQNVIYCGFHEYSNEICLHYTGFKGNYCPIQRQKKFKCNYVWMSNRLLSYVQNFFNRNIFTNVAATKDTSAGFFGILLALHLCGKVDIYGFNQRPNHYFNKQMNSRRAFGDKHAWALERQCSNLFSNLPAVSARS